MPAAPEEGFDLLALAPAKLNLGLAVTGKRPDGFHGIRTVFQAIDLEDRLHVRERAGSELRLRVTGPDDVPADPSNLVLRAAEALRRERAPGKGAEFHLEKRIPAGAGLGGGSSDAAAALLALERLWGLDPDPEHLRGLAAGLGSDVPFFLLGGTCRGEGRGEQLTVLEGPPSWGVALFLPGFGVSTAAAYARWDDKGLTEPSNRFSLLELALSQGDLALVRTHLRNDLEPGVLDLEPRLAALQGFLAPRVPGAAMTGSGSTYFALTATPEEARRLCETVDEERKASRPTTGTAPTGAVASLSLLAASFLEAGARVADA